MSETPEQQAMHDFVSELADAAGGGRIEDGSVLDYWWGMAAERLYHEGWRVTRPEREPA